MGPCVHRDDFTGTTWRETRAPGTNARERARYMFEQILMVRVQCWCISPCLAVPPHGVPEHKGIRGSLAEHAGKHPTVTKMSRLTARLTSPATLQPQC
jgi:hypothetical protein